MKGYIKYYSNKIGWYFITFIVALVLNFVLPRMMPGNPVATIAANAITPGMDKTQAQKILNDYAEKFGLDQPMIVQFWNFIKNGVKGDFGVSFSQYPREISDIVRSSMGWTIALQLPAILIGWILGNLLGAIAAYKKGFWDKGLLPAFLFIGNVPAFGMATILLFVFAIVLKIAPSGGGYGFDIIPGKSWEFVWSVFTHYQLPFWSIVAITVGGQAIGMRSMSIYELNADYVKYSRFLGIKDNKIVGYVFRNAMLPQVTGLAMSIGTMIGGNIVAETIFNYPGIGTTMLGAISNRDYPLISASTLMITIMVLVANLAIEILYGVIDPRIKAAQQDEG